MLRASIIFAITFWQCSFASGVLYNAQDMLLYHPDQPENSRIYVESPATMGLPYDNIFITTKDGVRHWYTPCTPACRLVCNELGDHLFLFRNRLLFVVLQVKLNLVLIKQPPVSLQNAPTYVFLHGNAGNVGHR